jgi:hypothetical protein
MRKPAALTARVCVPDRMVMNALSSAVFGLPSSFQLNTWRSMRVTVSRQAFFASGSLCGPHTAVSASRSTVVGGYETMVLTSSALCRMLALVSALVVDPLAGTSSATFCAVGVLPSNPLGSIGAHPARASIPETLQNTDNRDNRCIGLSPWDEWFRPAVPIDTARAES